MMEAIAFGSLLLCQRSLLKQSRIALLVTERRLPGPATRNAEVYNWSLADA